MKLQSNSGVNISQIPAVSSDDLNCTDMKYSAINSHNYVESFHGL